MLNTKNIIKNKEIKMSSFPPNPDNHTCYGEWCGWYTPGGANFAGFLHNPYGHPTEIEKKAIERYTKIIPNMEDYTYHTIIKFFKNKYKNKNEGLAKQYKKLQLYVIENKLIGVILWGADQNNIEREIIKYNTMEHKEISLTVNSVCKYLIKDYITQENVEELCKKSIE